MNKKKIQMIIVKALTVACITNVVVGSSGNLIRANAFTQQRVESKVLKGEEREGLTLLDENYSETKIETDINFKTWWEGSVRPSTWQLRKWSGASATGTNTPYGRVIEYEQSVGGKYVEVTCNNSVGFFQPDSSISLPQINSMVSIPLPMKKSF